LGRTHSTQQAQPEPPKIRILIVEDHFIARAGMGATINAQPDMTVIAEATNGEQAQTMYRQHRPDVTLMDMRMPVMNGFEAVAAIRAEFPEARIVALSTFGGDEDIRRALQAGAKSYLTKDVLHDDLVEAIHAVHKGEVYLPAAIQATLQADGSHAMLTARELDVLRLIVRGLSNKQIAYELKISEDTTKNHVKGILKKLDVDDRTQAATTAIQRGIIHLQY
jgi:two-component system NarL family response regulator